MDSDHEEILRIRERLHEAQGSLGGLVNSQRDVHRRVTDLQRELRELRRELVDLIAELRKKVDRMSQADELAAKVTEALDEQRKHVFTTAQKVVGAVAGLIMLVPSLAIIVTWAVSL